MRPMLILCLSICLADLLAVPAAAHPVPLAQARINLDTKPATFEILFDCDVTAYVMGTSPGHLGDELAAQLAALTDAELAQQVERYREHFTSHFEAFADRRSIEPSAIVFPPLADIRDVREALAGGVETEQSTITLRGSIPSGARALTLRFPRDLGAVLITIRRDGKDRAPQLIGAAQPSQPIVLSDDALNLTTPPPIEPPQEGDDPESDGDAIPPQVITVGQFAALGFWHILPTGPDHILFVLGLFLLSPAMKPLLWQVTAFTLAHSATLALAMLNLVRLPADIVEPLIAASIVFIAVENIFTSRLHPWRPIIVFAFGLLHGLGFAGVLTDLHMSRNQLAPALIGFNIGVEIGQLAVIAIAFLCVGWFRNHRAYRLIVVIPSSLLIAAIGAYWTVQRVFG